MSNKTRPMTNAEARSAADVMRALSKVAHARMHLRLSYDALLAAHKVLQSSDLAALEMTDGDVRSICGLPHPNSALGKVA